jgi:hypothetical protein
MISFRRVSSHGFVCALMLSLAAVAAHALHVDASVDGTVIDPLVAEIIEDGGEPFAIPALELPLLAFPPRPQTAYPGSYSSVIIVWSNNPQPQTEYIYMPEPTSAAVLLLGALACVSRRTRR